MRLIPIQTLVRCWLFLITCCLSGLVTAAPDYVTAWPKQVQVEKPDPVLGDKPFWEHWIYSESFAKRFKGFPADKADPELKDGGLEAMALRIFKKNFWQELNPNYPEQYACEIEVYFDSTISLPLSESGNPKTVFPAYPRGITAGYRRLEPYEEGNKVTIRASQPVRLSLKTQPLIFADQPLDGRYSSFGVREYRPGLAPGLSVITLLSGFECAVTAPLRQGGIHWLSLLGERPWDRTEGRSPKAVHGQYERGMNLVFDPGLDHELRGFFRVPASFNNTALPKAALIKVMNSCINARHSYARRHGQSAPPGEEWERRCRDTELKGVIDPGYPGKEGLQAFGY